jgi:hypothetical protein
VASGPRLGNQKQIVEEEQVAFLALYPLQQESQI